MTSLDMRTILFSHVITDIVCAVFISFLWYHNRNRFEGLFFWVIYYIMQVAALILIVMRGFVPVSFSIMTGNALIIGGAIILLMGLERFVGKQGLQLHNIAFLVVFIFIHAYFSFYKPNLAARSINTSLGMLLLTFQCMWLLLRRVDRVMKPITRGPGMVFAAYCAISLFRIILILIHPQPGEELFQPGTPDTLFILSYQILFVIKTYSLALLVNRRLIGDVQTQEDCFRSMVEFTSDWDYWKGPDGKLLYVTPASENLTGYRPRDFIEDPELLLKIVHPEDQAAVFEHMQEEL
ncbi:MAG: PAS domain-containing protein, partial [Thermodesulfobacteriota bacterium]